MDDSGFGKRRSSGQGAATPRTKPLKRPRQARARFTVEAIYEALVRIWQRGGWAAVTTRAVALEAGFAVGTLYEYFPNKQALLSGYVRHQIEALLGRIEAQVIAPRLGWQARVERLLALSCGPEQAMQSLFTLEVARLEAEIAEPKHYRRAYEEMLAVWQRVFAACDDLPAPVPAERVEALLLMVWGGRRYAALAQLDQAGLREWRQQIQTLLIRALTPA